LYDGHNKIAESPKIMWPNDFMPPAQYVAQQLWTYNIRGGNEVSTSQLAVTLYVQMHNVVTGAGSHKEVGFDGAYAKNGGGKIQLVGDQGPFQEGDSAQILVDTGWAGDNAWTVFLVPPADRPDLQKTQLRSVGNDKHETFALLIKAGWFKAGGTPGVSNIYEVELWTPLFEYGFVQVIPIDFKDRAPTTPVLTVSRDGPTATVRANSAATYKPIGSFILYAWYGSADMMPSNQDAQSWITPSTGIVKTATGGPTNFSAIFTINAKNQDGTISVKVMAVDVELRYSAPSFWHLTVVNGEFKDGGKKDVDAPFMWALATIMVALIGSLLSVGAALAMRGRKINARATVAIIGLVITAIITYIVGITPELALSMGDSVLLALGAFL
jgi:hypothetical protein